ncbi:hypothetical protein POTOM_013177 [Populus tomentosa]|uniref:Uncharacterized protein n=1 Tax=Populus tomentosa TaxID=118781 RepID=A0A8X8A092_POPTO|nr:hypothetical protein POTOM_013177 [Populus tomentosa]
MAASKATPEAMAFIVKHGTGIVYSVPDEVWFPEIKDVYTVPWTYSSVDQSEVMTSAHSATPALIVSLTDCEKPNGMD